jgi:hypothetical protein
MMMVPFVVETITEETMMMITNLPEETRTTIGDVELEEELEEEEEEAFVMTVVIEEVDSMIEVVSIVVVVVLIVMAVVIEEEDLMIEEVEGGTTIEIVVVLSVALIAEVVVDTTTPEIVVASTAEEGATKNEEDLIVEEVMIVGLKKLDQDPRGQTPTMPLLEDLGLVCNSRQGLHHFLLKKPKWTIVPKRILSPNRVTREMYQLHPRKKLPFLL